MAEETRQFISEKHTFISLSLMTAILGFVIYTAINIGVYKQRVDDHEARLTKVEIKVEDIKNFISKDQTYHREIMAK